MIKSITKDDVRELLNGFIGAIELDQIRVDALPASVFHHLYDDRMWRSWRREILEYIEQLLSTLDTIPPLMLRKLTRIATHYEPAVVGYEAIKLFGDGVAGIYGADALGTAALFFDFLIRHVMNQSEGKLLGEDAPALMMRWLSATDPLRIAQDPECGYGSHLGAFHG
jgi:hypothetical protein